MNRNLDSESRSLFLEVTEIVAELDSRLAAENAPRSPSNHSKSNWASEAHHLCERFLVYARVNWKERKGLDEFGRERVKDGKKLERVVRAEIEETGFEISHAQTAWTWDKFLLSGKIDGAITPKGYAAKLIPIEIKIMSEFLFSRVQRARTMEDLINDPIYWINKIPSQLNIYLVLMALPAGFLAIKCQGQRMKLIPMLINYDLADEDLFKLERVNNHVKKGTLPPRIPYSKKVCGRCDFCHICTPNPTIDFVDVGKVSVEDLDRYWEARKQKKSYDKIRAALIGTKDEPGSLWGKNTIIDDYVITTTRFWRNGTEVIRTDIDKFVEGPTPWDL